MSVVPSMGALLAFASHIKKHTISWQSLPGVNRAFGLPLLPQCIKLTLNSVAYFCNPSTQDELRKSNTSRSSSVMWQV